MKARPLFFLIVLTLSLLPCRSVFAHCDTLDGPLVADAITALEKNNVNYVLKWVQKGDEREIQKAFDLVMKVRPLNADARELADTYFFDVLVRIHRSGEGVPFTGVKPHGAPVDEKVKAADRAIESGNLAPLEKMMPAKKLPRLRQLYKEVMLLKKFDVNDVEKGREYIEAYVRFFKYAEGEGEDAHGHGHGH